MSETYSGFNRLARWIVTAILVIVALKVVFTVLGVAFMVGGFLFFRILPLVLVAWLVMKVVRWTCGSRCDRTPDVA